ncbi:MAG: hypothetical protein ACT6SF_17025 [Hydrogenophaga sp.]|jgi:hypothetical protein|uniref:hypothetical protein n=1 Tax=Hydrogenophaga sp. TaxID=1904254 RepID=UPI001D20C00C|nr:hypothetical protein [Hydrogenophaga sp.]MBW0170444.1 hypothetical protein [Hydrogenophaga sp.]MBW0184883.1 hypothetical protein [Hydrogenophaga sp.]
MKRQAAVALTAVSLAVLLAACQERPREASPAPAASAPLAAAPAADQWLGKWNGPEGTFLELKGGGGRYEVTVRNLDGPRTFPGTAVADGIEFERDGVKESLRATNGADTGMKWLADKNRCLTVRLGEGYCRD